MPSVNKVFVLGNVGKDPELRYTPNGGAVVNLTVATKRSWKNKDSGEKMEEVEWHRLSFFDRLAELVGEYVKKGDPIHVEGRLKTRKWTDKDGVERFTTEIIVHEMQLMGRRERSDGEPQGHQRSEQTPRQQSSGARPPHRPTASHSSSNSAASGGGGGGFDDMDDDIQF